MGLRTALLVLSDEASRRDSQSAVLRAQRARLDPTMQIEAWDPTARVSFDRTLLNELFSLRFLQGRAHVTIVGPTGVGKTFLAHAFGHAACRQRYSVLAVRTDLMLKSRGRGAGAVAPLAGARTNPARGAVTARGDSVAVSFRRPPDRPHV